jgi:hypothetical protein
LEPKECDGPADDPWLAEPRPARRDSIGRRRAVILRCDTTSTPGDETRIAGDRGDGVRYSRPVRRPRCTTWRTLNASAKVRMIGFVNDD